MMIGAAGTALLPGAANPTPIVQVSAADVQMKTVQIMGTLGKPLGTFSTIEGVLEHPTKSRLTMVVDTLDGKKIDAFLRVGLDGTTAAVGSRCILRGYETMMVYGTPHDPAIARPWQVVQQGNADGMFGYDFWFHVVTVEKAVAPEK